MNRPRARDLARGKWPSVLERLGVPSECLDGKHHPCPKDGTGDDRFRFADRDGTGSYFCACSAGKSGGMNLLMCVNGWDYASAAKEVEAVVDHAIAAPVQAQRDPRPALERMRKASSAPGAEVRAYLAGRGLELPPLGLRQVTADYWDNGQSCGKFPTMLGCVCNAAGKPVSYHRTYLQNGKKAPVDPPRKMMTPVSTIAGGAIRLYPWQPHFGLAEGIETAIAARMLYDIPVWSAIDAHGVESFEPPAGTERLTIFGDNDSNYAGQAAAYVLARRLSRHPDHRIQCDVRIPPDPDTDWNDVLLARLEKAA